MPDSVHDESGQAPYVDLSRAAVYSCISITVLTTAQSALAYDFVPTGRLAAQPRGGASHGVDLNEAFQAGKVSGIPRIQRKRVSEGGGCNKQIGEATPTAAAGPFQRSVDASVRTRHVSITRQGIPYRSRPLQAVLSASPLVIVTSGVRASSEFRESEPPSPEGEGFDGRLNSPKVRASTAGRFIRKYENRRLGTRHLASLYTSQ